MTQHRIGMIGGSGLYHLEGFTHQKWVKIKTPFGPTSDDLLTGRLPGATSSFSRDTGAAIAFAQRTEPSRQHMGA